jgi:uncharacterized protein DUF6444/transposase IS66 family protein
VSEPPASPSYGELAALAVEQAAQLAEQAVLIEALRVELEALRRQVGRDSSNSSQPPSTDGPGAKAKAKAGRRAAGREAQPAPEGQPLAGAPDRARRKQGGQPGHRGSGLAPVTTPDHRESVEPSGCGGCGGDLAGAPGTVDARVQVFDLPSFSVAVTEYLLMRRVCACGQATTADLPAGVRGGPTCYGPNVTAAATLLANQDVLGIERTADLMSALLGVAVSTGFISSCLTRLDDALTAAGFEQALKAALHGQDVVGTDETPAPLTAAAAARRRAGLSCFAVSVDQVPAAAQAARTARVSCGVACSGHGPRNLAAMMTRDGHVVVGGFGLRGVPAGPDPVTGHVVGGVPMQRVPDGDHAEADQPERHRPFDGAACPIAGLAHADDLAGIREGLFDSPPCGIAGDQIFRGRFQIGGDQREPIPAIVTAPGSGLAVAHQNDAHGSAAE